MRVSVVLTVYNKAQYLRECIESIFAQTFTDIEIIAVDDKSTDDSLSILRSIQDPRLKVVALERNLGHPGATQEAYDRCQGEYIVRCDADDISHPDRIARQVAFMDANPDVGASSCSLALFGSETEEWNYSADGDECKAQLLFGLPVADPACILRRSVLIEHDIRFRLEWPRVGSDWLFFAKFFRVSRMSNLSEVLLYYRRGDNNSSTQEQLVGRRKPIVGPLFGLLQLPGGAREQELHMILLRAFEKPLTPAEIAAAYGWLQRLEQWNREGGYVPDKVFTERTRAQWERLFYSLPRRGARLALAHMRQDGGWTRTKLLYLLKYSLRKGLGRLPKPVNQQ